MSKGIALRLRRICEYDETFDKCSTDYHNYLIATEHKSSLVKQQFSEVKRKLEQKPGKNKIEKKM